MKIMQYFHQFCSNIPSILLILKCSRETECFEATKAFGTGDFLNIFLRFEGFWGSFSDKNNVYCIPNLLLKSELFR